MTCRVQPLVALARHEDLPEADRATVLAHVASCSACRRRLDDERRVTQILADIRHERVAPPPRSLADVWERRHDTAHPRGLGRAMTAGLACAASIVLVVAVATRRSSAPPDRAALSGTSRAEEAQATPPSPFVTAVQQDGITRGDLLALRVRVPGQRLIDLGLVPRGASDEELVTIDVLVGGDGVLRHVQAPAGSTP